MRFLKLPLFPNEVGDGHATALEYQLGGVGRVHAELSSTCVTPSNPGVPFSMTSRL